MRRLEAILVVSMLLMGFISIPGVSAQELHGCYNKSGILYLIQEQGLKTECKDDHSQVDWSMTGPQGPPGPSGISGIHIARSQIGVIVDSGDVEAATAFCPTGEVATGGGTSDFTVLMLGIEPAMTQSSPFVDLTTDLPIGWTVIYANRGTGQFSFKAAAICAMVAP